VEIDSASFSAPGVVNRLRFVTANINDHSAELWASTSFPNDLIKSTIVGFVSSDLFATIFPKTQSPRAGKYFWPVTFHHLGKQRLRRKRRTFNNSASGPVVSFPGMDKGSSVVGQATRD